MENEPNHGLQPLTERVALRFGSTIHEAQRILSIQATDATVEGVSRVGIDRQIVADTFVLSFDTGLLCNFQFKSGFAFLRQIAPFPEPWKNPCPIDGRAPEFGMAKHTFLGYLAAWETRARELGAHRRRRRSVLRDGEYAISTTSDRWIEHVFVAMAPERLTLRGGRWGDSLSFQFTTSDLDGTDSPILKSIAAFRDEFNTNARHG